MTSSLFDLSPAAGWRTQVPAATWQEAVRAAGDALVAGGITTAAYTDQMIEAITTLGPYVVIVPGLALAHARPSDAVLTTGFSWVTLAEPVNFGSHNDPVRIIVGLAAKDHDQHLSAMAGFAGMLSDPHIMDALASAPTPEALGALIERSTT